MCPISNSERPNSFSEEPGENRSVKSPAELKLFFKELIAKANSVPLKNIFSFYKIKASEYNKKIICPFLKHDNGRENTPSFNFYPDTNSFWCYGCKTGNYPVDFVSAIEDISKAKAAYKILKLFESDVNHDDNESVDVDYSERLEVLMEFSEFVREFIQADSSIENVKYIEKLTSAFDSLYSKHDLDNTAIKTLVLKIKNKASK